MNENEDSPWTPPAPKYDWREALGVELTEALRREKRRDGNRLLQRLAQQRPAEEDDKDEGKTLHNIAEAYWQVAEERADYRRPTRQQVADKMVMNRRTLYTLCKNNGIPWPPPRPRKPPP